MSEVAIILGSARSDGNTRQVVNVLLNQLGPGASLFDLNDYQLEYFDYNKEYANNDYGRLCHDLFKFKYWIFATPIYWYSMSAIMKNFFDRITDLLEEQGEFKSSLQQVHIGVLSCSGADNAPSFFGEPFKLSADYLGMGWLGHTHAWTSRLGHIKAEAEDNLNQFVERINRQISDKENLYLAK